MTTPEQFKAALSDNDQSDEQIVQRYLVHGGTAALDEDHYFDLRREVGRFFKVHFDTVKMVGSAKLGFSLKPTQLFKPFDENSDIDIAIISDVVFDSYWRDLHEFNINLEPRTFDKDKKFNKFLRYFFRGWLRPDLFPFSYARRSDWDTFFKSVSYHKYGNYKINGAVYRNSYFFENYHILNIRNMRSGGF